MTLPGTRAGIYIVALAVLGFDQLTKALLPIQEATARISPVLMAVAVTCCAWLAHRRRQSRDRWFWWAAVGAGVANTVDIYVFHYVRDVFIVGTLAFNVADAVLLGSFIGILVMSFPPNGFVKASPRV